jgi:2-dehydropantoate 2-reductase
MTISSEKQATGAAIHEPRIVVAGAGAIGCFVGGLLAAAGRDVVLLGRARILDELATSGLNLTDFAGLDAHVDAPRCTSDPGALAGAKVVLVAVKTGATAEMAAQIATHAPNEAVVVSLQNGVEAARVLRAALPGRDVRAGMVGFNVVAMGGGRFHRSVSGDMVIEQGQGDLAAVLAVPGLEVKQSREIAAVQWGKLLINLNNAVNALSGMALRDMMMARDWRRVMADQLAEGIAVLRGAGIAVKMPQPVPAGLVPHILRLPTPLFARVAAAMLTVDPIARTSMAVDLAAGRVTEVDQLQGEIIALADRHGTDAPICRRVASLVHEAEINGLHPLSPEDLRA